MSVPTSRSQQFLSHERLKAVVRRVLQYHIPVHRVNRPLFSSLYRLHTAVREAASWSIRFFWYEPLFRSQCQVVGERFQMESLPYLVGRGELTIGSDVNLSGKSSFAFSSRHCESPRLSIGDGSFLGHNCAINVGLKVIIGDHCLIAGGVRISDFDGHPIDALDRRNGKTTPTDCVLPVTIGDDVWIGYGAMILKGVRIGNRAIIGAGSVVTGDVEADTIVAGNPARVIRSIKVESRGDL